MHSEEIIKKFGNSKNGLSSAEVTQLQKRYGQNITLYPRKQWYQLLARQLLAPFTYLLTAAAIIAFMVNDIQTAAIILIIIMINTGLSFFQEYRAERALHILNTYIQLHVTVLRDGKKQIIPSIELVPGDIVYLTPQTLIPADLQLLESEGLLMDESALSGESEPVAKNAAGKETQETLCYLGTIVATGSGKAIVTATGARTRFGTINKLTTQKKQVSHFSATMNTLSKLFFIITVITACLVISMHLFLNGMQNFETTLLFAIALALSMTPEALPVVITVALSRGAARLAKQHVLVKRLSAIEDLGDITILCTDKTGTLTQNKLVFTDSLPLTAEYDFLALASISEEKNPSIFEQALQAHLQQKDSSYTAIRIFPFDPKTRTQSVIVRDAKTNSSYMITKGAIESLASVHSEKMEKVFAWESEKGAQGQRVIGCALKVINSDTVTESDLKDFSPGELIGLLAFEDPLKDTSKDALEMAKRLGIKIKIISGDSKIVSGAIAHQLGLIESPDMVITGAELAQLSLADQEKALHIYNVFARISPEQKYMIVETLKKNDVVGYLGDGINDAPALKTAHIGIVVQEATDLAKSIADIILLKKDLNVIINGIALGRTTFANTIKYIKITLAGNTGNVITLSIVSFILPYLPLLPLQVLLVNLLCDIPMIAIGTDAVDPHDLRRPASYTSTDILKTTVIFGLIGSLSDTIFFSIFHTLPAAFVQTYWFIDNIVSEMLFVLSMRTKKIFLKKPYPSAILLSLLMMTGIIALALPFTSFGEQFFAFVQPHLPQLVLVLGISCVYFMCTEIVKLLYIHFFDHHKHKKISH